MAPSKDTEGTSPKAKEQGTASQGIAPAPSAQSTAGTPDSPKEEFSVLAWAWGTGEYDNSVIKGIVQNNTDKEYGYLQVEFNLYDKDDNQVGSTFANVNNVEPHGKWKFEAMVMESTARSARLKGVTGF